MLNTRKQENYAGISAEQKYYRVADTFVKRSLRPREWHITLKGTSHLPRSGRVRLLNDAAVINEVCVKASQKSLSLYFLLVLMMMPPLI
jgi:hypothetical protein